MNAQSTQKILEKQAIRKISTEKFSGQPPDKIDKGW